MRRPDLTKLLTKLTPTHPSHPKSPKSPHSRALPMLPSWESQLTLAHRCAIFLCYLGCEIDDQYRNSNVNNKDHLVGQLTKLTPTHSNWPNVPNSPQLSQYHTISPNSFNSPQATQLSPTNLSSPNSTQLVTFETSIQLTHPNSPNSPQPFQLPINDNLFQNLILSGNFWCYGHHIHIWGINPSRG